MQQERKSTTKVCQHLRKKLVQQKWNEKDKHRTYY